MERGKDINSSTRFRSLSLQSRKNQWAVLSVGTLRSKFSFISLLYGSMYHHNHKTLFYYLQDDVEDALTIDKTIDDLAEGKVPLFYIEDFEITTSTEEKKQEIPLYFQKKQLVQAWKKQNPRKELPEVKVTELFSVVKTMVNPDSKDDDLERLALIPPGESIAKSKICTEKGGKSEAFKLGERIVVL